MLRFILDIILILVGFLFQQIAFEALSLGGIVPNILLIIVAVHGFISGQKSGVITGFFAGLLIDIFYGQYLGINALIYLLIGYFNGYYKGGFFPDDIKIPLLYTAISDIAYSIMYYAIYFLPRGRMDIILYLKNICLPEFIYTMILALIIYKPLLFLLRITDPYKDDNRL